MTAAGERHHLKGLEGLDAAKLWLESTTRFDVHWSSWGKARKLSYVIVPQINGESESFDLVGNHLDEEMQPLAQFYAEVKNHAAQNKQKEQYAEYLTRCYSATVAWRRAGEEKEPEFIWLTWHPFGATNEYNKLTTVEAIEKACEELPERVPPEDYDPEIAESLAERLWLLIASPRLGEMMMSLEFLSVVEAHVRVQGIPLR